MHRSSVNISHQQNNNENPNCIHRVQFARSKFDELCPFQRKTSPGLGFRILLISAEDIPAGHQCQAIQFNRSPTWDSSGVQVFEPSWNHTSGVFGTDFHPATKTSARARGDSSSGATAPNTGGGAQHWHSGVGGEASRLS